MKRATANQIIDSLYWDDIISFDLDGIHEIGWRYYVHLNKLLAPLERDGAIRFTGIEVVGERGRLEKVWEYVQEEK